MWRSHVGRISKHSARAYCTLAIPGEYKVRLTMDGQSQEQEVYVKMDPRVQTTAANCKSSMTFPSFLEGSARL